jgi:glycyl-tRNA synthetase (class II)
VTVRERDSMTQIRIPIDEVKGTLAAKIAGEPIAEGSRVWRAGTKEEPKS